MKERTRRGENWGRRWGQNGELVRAEVGDAILAIVLM